MSEGLSFAKLENSGEEEKKIQKSEYKVRHKRTTKAFRRDRETAWINKSGFRFQEEEDEAMAYMVKKAKEVESEV